MTEPNTSPSSQVDAIADRYVADYAAADPVTATFLGIAGYDDQLTDLTSDGYDQRDALTRRARAAMAEVEASDDHEQAAKSSFLERLAVEIDQAEARAPQTRVSVISSELHSIRGAFDLMAKATPDDWANISTRLGAIPNALADYRETLLQGAADGYVSAKRQIAEVAAQVRAWTGEVGEGGNFFRNLAGEADVPETLQRELLTNAKQASDGYAAFGRFLDDELLAK